MRVACMAYKGRGNPKVNAYVRRRRERVRKAHGKAVELARQMHEALVDLTRDELRELRELTCLDEEVTSVVVAEDVFETFDEEDE